MNNVNCRCFTAPHFCTSIAAPQRLFRRPVCVEVIPIDDERAPRGCSARMPYKNPIEVFGRITECPPMPPRPVIPQPERGR